MSNRKHAWAAYHAAPAGDRDPNAVESAAIRDFLDLVDERLADIESLARDCGASNVSLGLELASRELRTAHAEWEGVE